MLKQARHTAGCHGCHGCHNSFQISGAEHTVSALRGAHASPGAGLPAAVPEARDRPPAAEQGVALVPAPSAL